MSAEGSLKWPELYKSGQKQELTSPLVLTASLLYSVYSSLVFFFIPCGVFYNSAFDYQTMAVTVAMAATFTATIEVRLTDTLIIIILTCDVKTEGMLRITIIA